jgi:hypothetical protein
MVAKFLNYFSQWVFIVSTVGGVGVCSTTSEKITSDCLYKFTEHYCSQSQNNFTEALEKCKDYASLLTKECIHAGLKKGFKISESLKERYPLLVEAVLADRGDNDPVKKKTKRKRLDQSQQSVAKENLIARCKAVREGITAMLTKNGVSRPASHPLILQIQKLLAELVSAPQVDALLLLQAGQCDGIGEAALALLPDSQQQPGIESPCLRPPSPRRLPTVQDDQQTKLFTRGVKESKAAIPSSFLSSDPSDTLDKTPGVEPQKIPSTNAGGTYVSGQLPSENNKEKDLLP